jgi:hypothetical protein
MAEKPQLTPREQSKKRRADDSNLTDSDNDTATFPHFLIAETVDGQPLKYSIITISKLLQCAVGTVTSAKKLRSGSVLIEVANRHQAELALRLNTWIDVPMKVSPHKTLNTSRGIIRCREFRDCDDAEVKEALQSQGVIGVRHIFATRNGKKEATNTFILTFNSPTPPTAVKAAYMKLTVEPYIPNPLRCYKCQKFGHGQNTCKHCTVCARCGQDGHVDTDCQAPAHCLNCRGDHPAYSKDCPQWLFQREVTAVKFTQNVSFREAKEIVLKRASTTSGNSGSPRDSYAQVASPKPQMQESGVQTDLTWPLCSKVPVHLNDVEPVPTEQPAPTSTISVQTTQTAFTTSNGKLKESNSSSMEGAVGGHATPLSKTTGIPRSANTLNSKQAQKPGPVSSKTHHTTRQPKGSDDPVKSYNRFGSLDCMDVEVIHSPRNGSPKHKK